MVKSIQKFFSAYATVEKLYNKECNYAPNPNFIQIVPKSTSCINSILCIDSSLQTKDFNTCTYPQEGIKILASNFNYSEKKINCKPTRQEGGVNLFTNFNQLECSKRHYVCTPRKGVTNLCTDLDQSQPSLRYYERSPREGAVNLCTDLNRSESR